MPSHRFVGVTVMPEYFQVEGVTNVLDGLASRAGATAITISPYVMEPADAATGAREPPIDAGAGSVRLLERPLWGGKRELFVRTAPAYAPDRARYAGLRYQPPEPGALTKSDGAIIAETIAQAKARGMEVYFQVQSACPPGFRVGFGGPADEDKPRLPDFTLPTGRVDNNASLASADVRAHLRALIGDLCAAYPDIDGIRLDWPEYPPYRLDDLFYDFSDPARAAARRLGFDFEWMRHDALALYRTLTGANGSLDAATLRLWTTPEIIPALTAKLLADRPGIGELLKFRAALVAEFLTEMQAALRACGPGRKLVPNAFPPPWSIVSGFDYRKVAGICDGMSLKLYTMHWPMMLRFVADRLLAAHPTLDPDALARTLAAWADTGDGISAFADLEYPAEDAPHPVGLAAQRRKCAYGLTEAAAGGAGVFHAIVHGYGPLPDFTERLRAGFEASDGRIWVNRYGYLADAKLDAIGAVARPS